jgi:hypothetical protein
MKVTYTIQLKNIKGKNEMMVPITESASATFLFCKKRKFHSVYGTDEKF